MRQILQNLSTGATEVVEVPTPQVGFGQLAIRSHRSLISSGTEVMLLEFGRAGWIEKARLQPERVREVLLKARTDGVAATAEAVWSKLQEPIALGYCNVGIVEEKGSGITDVQVGDRVASNGPHAEMVAVPRNLCAKVPDNVGDDEAAFTVIGAVALQGVRLAQPTLGECFVVIGLGLVGLMTVQILRAHGCRVLGVDLDPERLDLAREFGAKAVLGRDPGKVREVAKGFSRDRGVDGVLLTLASTSNDPIHQAANVCRKRGRIVLVGVSGLQLNRADFYEKELSFQVSCSYGPGRYDPNYELRGHDYPVGFVRWTEQRNFEAVLDMIAEGKLDVEPLITHRFSLHDAPSAYRLLASKEENSLGILLEYVTSGTVGGQTLDLTRNGSWTKPASGEPVLAVIGTGNYAKRTLIPAFSRAGSSLHTLVNRGSPGGVRIGKKFGFRQHTTNVDEAFLGPINTVVIATRHDSHALLVKRSLENGMNVFVEKPLALNFNELESIAEIYEKAHQRGDRPHLMVGFNRRFSPHASRIRQLLNDTPGPKAFVMTVNAGHISPDHWTQDPQVGGGRIIGEACHFVDFLRCLARSRIVGASASAMDTADRDSVVLNLRFEDGSIGTIHYLANGHKSIPKERLEVYAKGRVIQLNNFRRLRSFGWPGFRSMNLYRQDKGNTACVEAFLKSISDGDGPSIPFEEILEVSRVTLELAQQARQQ